MKPLTLADLIPKPPKLGARDSLIAEISKKSKGGPLMAADIRELALVLDDVPKSTVDEFLIEPVRNANDLFIPQGRPEILRFPHGDSAPPVRTPEQKRAALAYTYGARDSLIADERTALRLLADFLDEAAPLPEPPRAPERKKNPFFYNRPFYDLPMQKCKCPACTGIPAGAVRLPDPVEFHALPVFEKLRRVCEKVTYKEGWSFRAEPAWFSGPSNSALLEISCTVPNRDSNQPFPLTFTKHVGEMARADDLLKLALDANYEQTVRYVYESTVEFEKHEAAEFFKVDGERVFDPHNAARRLPGYPS